ncbi:uncharacterized protein B0H18DRAFT_958923, partial [Fomitopsis serialis]|uniref:uncharacterized protein n=1 Tax=Fomitopsis serialis TaxID=139415 RepID=UPI0020077FEF
MYHDSGTREKSISWHWSLLDLQSVPPQAAATKYKHGWRHLWYILPVESLHWFCRCWVGPFVPEEIPEVEGPREFNAFVNDILCMIDWIRGLERSKLVPPVSWLLPDRGETAVIVTGYEDQKKGVSRIPEDDRQVRARDWFVKHANLVAGENIFVSDNLQYFCTAEENLELPLALCFDPPPQTGKEKAAEPYWLIPPAGPHAAADCRGFLAARCPFVGDTGSPLRPRFRILVPMADASDPEVILDERVIMQSVKYVICGYVLQLRGLCEEIRQTAALYNTGASVVKQNSCCHYARQGNYKRDVWRDVWQGKAHWQADFWQASEPGEATSAAKPGSAKPTSSGKPASTRATSSGKPANAGGKPAGVRKVPAAVIAETSDVEGGDGNGSRGPTW